MKIWFGFASNHSGQYAVLGKFMTVEAAGKAEEILNKILPEWQNAESKNDKVVITGPDGQQMTVDAVDWEDEPSASVSGKVVVVGLYTSGYGIDDIQKIMKKIGAVQTKTRSEDDIYKW